MTADCVNARRCVGFDRTTRSPALTADRTGALCRGCVNRAAADIAALPGDYAALAAELTPAGRGPAPTLSGGDTDAPVPMALAVDALRRAIVWTLTVWEPPVREAAGLSPGRGRGVRDVWAVTQAARVLTAHVWTFAALGPTWGYAEGLDAGPVERDGPAGMETLRALHLTAERAVGATRLTTALPGPCQSCGAEALWRDDGSDTVSCAVCDRRQGVDDYRRYVNLLLDAVSLTAERG
jgi:hypothetical protein